MRMQPLGGSSLAGQRLVARAPAATRAAMPARLLVQARSIEAGARPPPMRCGRQLRAARPSARPLRPEARSPSRSLLFVRRAGVGIFGTKAGMTTLYDAAGNAQPATVIAIEPGNVVTQVKTAERDGYAAVQVGYREAREGRLRKPEAGHCAKAGAPPLRHLREFKVASTEGYAPGQALAFEEMFKVGDLVDVAGTSIGKGFQGGIKRFGFARGNMTHGSKSKREHGSIGPGSSPGRVYPGAKLPGLMGNARVKARKSEILLVDAERRAIVVKGSVAGKPGNVVEIAPAKIVGVNV
jgi:large subunit ribosomal protein L3